ncbi:MAG: DEAD/DEAH box helicase [Velocimicrobium sp.]
MEKNIQKTTFHQYELSHEIIEALSLLGYIEPTQIQKMTIPLILSNKDVVGKSQTGTGKTAAFGIPLCSQIKWEENLPQVLILEPTRELAVQVKEELFQIGRKKRIKIPVIFGGMPIDKEIISLKQKAHMVVGTPGRVMDHIKRGSLILDKIQYLVIDEADLMLDMGFLEEVEKIIEEASKNKKIGMALFSATLGEELSTLVSNYMEDANYVEVVSESETVKSIEQLAYQVENDDKFNLLLKLMYQENPEECMIFCDTREMVNALYQQLKRKKIRCGMLHGGMEQRERLYAINDFRKGKFHLFITTDVAARGIDFPNITHVINYDLPTNKENYVHRVGRTGRNGKSGKAISFMQSSEKKMKETIEQYARISISFCVIPYSEEGENKKQFLNRQKEKVKIREGKEAVFRDTIMKLTIGGGKKSKIRASDIVGTICSIEGLASEDIGIIDVRDSITYVEIFNGKGDMVFDALQTKTVKGKVRKIKKTS